MIALSKNAYAFRLKIDSPPQFNPQFQQQVEHRGRKWYRPECRSPHYYSSSKQTLRHFCTLQQQCTSRETREQQEQADLAIGSSAKNARFVCKLLVDGTIYTVTHKIPRYRFCQSTKQQLLEQYLSSYLGRTDQRKRFWSHLNNSKAVRYSEFWLIVEHRAPKKISTDSDLQPLNRCITRIKAGTLPLSEGR